MLGVKCDNRNPYHGQWQSLGTEHWVGKAAISFWLLALSKPKPAQAGGEMSNASVFG
jgi:hypothetical protein